MQRRGDHLESQTGHSRLDGSGRAATPYYTAASKEEQRSEVWKGKKYCKDDELNWDMQEKRLAGRRAPGMFRSAGMEDGCTGFPKEQQ